MDFFPHNCPSHRYPTDVCITLGQETVSEDTKQNNKLIPLIVCAAFPTSSGHFIPVRVECAGALNRCQDEHLILHPSRWSISTEPFLCWWREKTGTVECTDFSPVCASVCVVREKRKLISSLNEIKKPSLLLYLAFLMSCHFWLMKERVWADR